MSAQPVFLLAQFGCEVFAKILGLENLPASEFLVALTITMNLIVVSPIVVSCFLSNCRVHSWGGGQNKLQIAHAHRAVLDNVQASFVEK